MAGETVPVRIQSMKRKSLRLGVTSEGVIEVKVPLRCPKYAVEQFLVGHNEWLRQRLADVKQQQQRQQAQLQYLGELLDWRADCNIKGIVLSPDEARFPASWDEATLRGKTDLWLRQQARGVFEQLIDQWWSSFERGAMIARPILRVKQMRTRWGSLSTRGYINLNMRLMHLPPALIELVVVHELCHSHHLNHSAAFYDLLEQHLPNHRVLEAQLKSMEASLMY